MEDYDLGEVLSETGHSRVYRGRQKRTTSYVAVKRVSLARKDRTLNEGQMMHALNHERVLKFKAWYVTQNNIWLVLEYCVGGPLIRLLQEDLKLPPGFIRAYGADLATALQYLHSQGVIHCNLKPSNVLLDGLGRVKLAGLGLSVRLDAAKTGALRRRGPATPCYMAPELFHEEAPFSSASDIWALGCMLYECCAGHPPFLSSSFQELVHAILHTEPAPLQGAPPELQELVAGMLTKHPGRRPRWPDICAHPFWREALPMQPLPPQPDFEAFLAAHYPPDEPDSEQEESAQMQSVRQSIADMSLAATENLMRDATTTEAIAEKPAAVVQGAIQLHHADAELDFHQPHAEAPPAGQVQAADGEGASEAGEEAGGLHRFSSDVETDMVQETTLMRQSVVAARLRSSPEASPSVPVAAGNGQQQDASTQQAHAMANRPVAGGSAHACDLGELLFRAEATAQPRPLIGNRRIELVPEPVWDSDMLGFAPLTAETLLDPPAVRTEQHLTAIFKALSLPLPVKEKVNVCLYLEGLCANGPAADLLIQSRLALQLTRQLRNSPNVLKERGAAALGLLIRYTTYIDPELPPTSLVDSLAECARNGSTTVRRRAMASLGELLFYIASQQDEDAWRIPLSMLGVLTRALRPGEDPITQHYAIHAIHNMVSRGGAAWAERLATPEVARALMQIADERAVQPAMREAAAATLAHALHTSPQLCAYVLKASSWHFFIAGLLDSSPRLQASAATMLGLALLQPGLQDNLLAASKEEQQGVLDAVLRTLTCPGEALVTKALVIVTIMCEVSPLWLLMACEGGLPALVDENYGAHSSRQTGQGSEDVQQAAGAWVADMAAIVNGLGPQVEAAVADLAASFGSQPQQPQADAYVQQELLDLLAATACLLPARTLRAASRPETLLQHLSAALHASLNAQAALPLLATLKEHILMAVEGACKDAASILSLWQPLLTHAAPVLARTAACAHEEGVLRFVSLEILCNIVTCLLQPKHPAPDGLEEQLHAVLQQHVLAPCVQVLAHDHTLPLHALKLLASLLQARPSYAPLLVRLGVAEHCFGFLAFDSPNNHVHNITVCMALIKAGAVPADMLAEHDVPAKVATLVRTIADSDTPAFWEPVMRLSLSLLHAHSAITEVAQSLAAVLPSFVSIALLTGGRGCAACDAAECVHRLADLACSCRSAAQQLLSGPCIAALRDLLAMDGVDLSILHMLLQAIAAAAQRLKGSQQAAGDVNVLCAATAALATNDAELESIGNAAAAATAALMDCCC